MTSLPLINPLTQLELRWDSEVNFSAAPHQAAAGVSRLLSMQRVPTPPPLRSLVPIRGMYDTCISDGDVNSCLLLRLRVPSGFLVVFGKPNRSSFTFVFACTWPCLYTQEAQAAAARDSVASVGPTTPLALGDDLAATSPMGGARGSPKPSSKLYVCCLNSHDCLY